MILNSDRWNSAGTRRRFLAQVSLGTMAFCAGMSVPAASQIEPPEFLQEWGEHGDAPGQFDACVGIVLGKDEIVYTSEFRNKRIQRFTSEGRFIDQFPLPLSPGGMAIDADGNMFVGFWNDNKVAAFAPDGKFLREWGQKGTGEGEFQLPGSIAYGPDGLIYVPDQGNSRVQKFTTDGNFVGKWGEHGSEPGQFGGTVDVGSRFAGPQFVAFDRKGNVYTTDAALDRVQKFTPGGELLAVWGDESAEPGGFGPPPLQDGKPVFGGPIALCVDDQDRVWVSATNSRVQLFNNDGKYLCGLGGEGSQPGQFERPHGVALDSNGCLYVVDTMNFRIQKFAFG